MSIPIDNISSTRNGYSNDAEVNIVEPNAATSDIPETDINKDNHDVDDEDIFQGFDQEWGQVNIFFLYLVFSNILCQT